MKNTSLVFSFCAVALTMFSCVQKRFVYAPPPPNLPFFTKKGESKVSAYLSKGAARGDSGDSRYNIGYDLQGAYALANHWAVTTNFYKRTERDSYKSKPGDAVYDYFDTATIDYARSMTEIGLGYFSTGRTYEPKFSIYSGVGFGNFNLDENGRNNGLPYTRSHNSRVFKFYLQPGFSVNASKNVVVAFLTRISVVQYSAITTSYNDDELRHFKLVSIYSKPASFFEPSFIIQYQFSNIQWLKVEGDFTVNKSFTSSINSRGSNASLGVVFDFSRLGAPRNK